jgi:hypothetical protein
MSDDQHKRKTPDRTRIDLDQEYEVQYWAAELGVTPEELEDMVRRVGTLASDVRKALRR